MKTKICCLIVIAATCANTAQGEVRDLSFTHVNGWRADINGSTYHDSARSGNTDFQNTLERSIGDQTNHVTVFADQPTTASATTTTLDLVSTLRSEIRDIAGNGPAAVSASCNVFFELTAPAYCKVSGGFTASSIDETAGCGLIAVVRVDPEPDEFILYFGEGNFINYSGSDVPVPAHSGTYPRMLVPGSYHSYSVTSCAGPNGSLGHNHSSASASISVKISGIPTPANIPPVRIDFERLNSPLIVFPKSREGLSYQLQEASTLQVIWMNSGSEQSGTGNDITFSPQKIMTDSERFYRVQVYFTNSPPN